MPIVKDQSRDRPARDERDTTGVDASRQDAEHRSEAGHDGSRPRSAPFAYSPDASAQTSFPVPASASGHAQLIEARKFFATIED